MYKKLTAIVVAMAMVLTSSMVVMASAPAENEGNVDKINVDKIFEEIGAVIGDDAELGEALEGLFGEVTDDEGSFDADLIGMLLGSLFGADDAEDGDAIERTPGFLAAINEHLLEETADEMEAGDETVFSYAIADMDLQEDGILNILGYFTIVNFDVDEECPDDLILKNGADQIELLTLELNEDGEYEVTECVSAEEGEGFIDSVLLLCAEMDVDPEDFFEELAATDFTYVADLYKFMEAHPEYDHIEYRGDMLTLDDLDATLDELFEAYLALYAIDAALTEAEAEDTAEIAEDDAAAAVLGEVFEVDEYIPGDAELAESLEALFDDVTEDSDFDPEDIRALLKGLFTDYGEEEEEERSVRVSDLYDAIDNHLLEETSEYLEAGDESFVSYIIGDVDEDEDGTVHLLGYFMIMNFDVDEEDPDDLLVNNGIGLTELLTLELNEDGEYEVTDCITAEDSESYSDTVAEMCEYIGLDPDAFYEEMEICDLVYVSYLYNFLIDHPEYDHIEYMGELVSLEELDELVDELFADYLAFYGLAELVAEAEAAEAAEEAVNTKSFQLSNSSYTIEIPESYVEGELSEKNVKNDMVAYMKSPDYGMDFCVYEFSNEGLPEELGKVAIMEAIDYNTTEIKTDVMINGMNVPYIRCIQTFEGKDYNTITYYLDGGDTIIEVEFWLDGDNAEELTDMIISTLSSTKN